MEIMQTFLLNNVWNVGIAFWFGCMGGYIFAQRTVLKIATKRVDELKQEVELWKTKYLDNIKVD